MSACKHCSRCKDGCSDVCKCCGICNTCGQQARPAVAAPAPVFMPVPYAVPNPMPVITPYPIWAQPAPFVVQPFNPTIEITCYSNWASGCAAGVAPLGECQAVMLTAEAQMSNWLIAREFGVTS